MASWEDVVAFSQPLSQDGEAGNDRIVTHRVMGMLPVIVWDGSAGARRTVSLRWGFPDTRDPRIPKPIHARAETIDAKPSFARAFADGQRGIVLARTFNEAPDLPGKTLQHVITPGDANALGIAFVWRKFETFAACVMVTVPANTLLTGLPTDRMPAILAPDDWAVWLGEESATPERIKACLKTVEGARWTMHREESSARARRAKPVVSDPRGLG